MNPIYHIERLTKRFLELRERKRVESLYKIKINPSIPFDYIRIGEVIKSYNVEISNLMDVGAHHGLFSAAMKQFWQFDKVVCVEPNINMNEIIYQNVGKETKIHNLALGLYDTKTVFYIHPNTTMNSLVPIDKKVFKEKFKFYQPEEIFETTVNVCTLDRLIEHLPVATERNTLLKIDTQGNEIDVLKGGKLFLKKVSFAVVEWMFWGGYKNEYTLKDLIEYMEEQQFVCVGVFEPQYRDSGQVACADFLFSAKLNG